VGSGVHSAFGAAHGTSVHPPINWRIMNPRYRRMVIPGALVGLILIVVAAALLKG
jgi:hypothetical protein